MEETVNVGPTMNEPTRQALAWLEAFGRALDYADYDAAMALFEDDAVWRQLSARPKALLRCRGVSFRTNRTAITGKDAIRAMLEATTAAAEPGQWEIDGPATECDGIVDSWFTFATTVSQGIGFLRLEGGKCWMLSTTTVIAEACC